jgi:hypothetical protein
LLDGTERVLGLERSEVANEIDIPTALYINERAYELVVRVQAAREDDG